MMHQWNGYHANTCGLKRPWENPPQTQITPLPLLSPTSTRYALIKGPLLYLQTAHWFSGWSLQAYAFGFNALRDISGW